MNMTPQEKLAFYKEKADIAQARILAMIDAALAEYDQTVTSSKPRERLEA